MAATRTAKVKASCKAFSDDTTFHGCKECFYANWFWKTIWTLILVGCTAVTFYQSYVIVYQSYQIPTNTLVRRIDETPLYPPITFCYPHWIYWVDWGKVNRLNLSRETFLFGMSMLGNVFVSQWFNVSEAESEFREFVSENFSDLNSYYLTIAKDDPLGVHQRQIDHFDRSFHQQYGTMCYSTNNTFAVDKHDGQPTSWFVFNFKFPFDTSIINSEEHFAYIDALERKRRTRDFDKNKTWDIVKVDLFLDGSDNKLSPSYIYDEYIIKLKRTVFDWVNLYPYMCSEDEAEVGNCGIKHCQQRCQLQAMVKNANDCWIYFGHSRLLSQDLFLNDVCPYGIYVLNKSNSDDDVEIFSAVQPTRTVNETYEESCRNNCFRACRQWIYESSIITNLDARNIYDDDTLYRLILTIQYPSDEEILLFAEVPTQTWDSLIAQIGGIMSLWIGGSVVSLVQAIYLFFCSKRNMKTKGETTKL